MQRTACTRGFTLYEALVTLTILSILLAMGVPAFGNLARRTELRGEHDLMITAIQRARGLAVETAGRVVVCPSVDRDTCSDDPAWHNGWLVFADDDGDRERDPDETVYEAQQALEGKTTITSSRYRRRIGFLPTGMSFGTNVTLRFCPESDHLEPRAIILSNAGRTRTETIPRSACREG